MKLDVFMSEMEETLKEFKKHWLEENAKDPEMFPLDIEDDNDGIWFEQFLSYCDSRGL